MGKYRPGFLGNTLYWFDTPAEEVVLEKSARSAHSSSGSARGQEYKYIPRFSQKRKYLFDWLPMKKKS